MKISTIFVLLIAVVCGTVAINNTILLRDSLEQLDNIKSYVPSNEKSKVGDTNITKYITKNRNDEGLVALRQDITNLRLQIVDLKEKLPNYDNLHPKIVENTNPNFNNDPIEKVNLLVNSNRTLDKLNEDLTSIYKVKKSLSKEEYLSACIQRMAESLGLVGQDAKIFHETMVYYAEKFESINNDYVNIKQTWWTKHKQINERYRDNDESPDCQKEEKMLNNWFSVQDKQINDRRNELKNQLINALKPITSENNVLHKAFIDRINSNFYLNFFVFDSTWQ